MAEVATHPTGEELAAFVAGRLSSARQRLLERHIENCGECCRRLETLPEDTLVERLRTPHAELPTPSIPEPPTRRFVALDESIPPELVDHPRYRVIRSIGGGGMGQVFLAEHRIMERPVVLKIVRRELLTDPFAVKRFRIEVKAAAQLGHPNIVHAHDADQAGELHFLVMEFVEGTSLSKAVARHGPLPLVNACNYIRQAAQGLAHAHQKGMVHRDIKPQNLMLTPAGQVKILDFGLAQFAREAALHDPTTASPATAEHSGTIVTEAGTVFGTPDYMAPEQAKSARDVDIRADIYSLGCTLYFLLTGKPPFPAGTSLDKINAHRSRPFPPLTGTRDSIPPELAVILEKMTAKEPLERYATPTEIAQALAPLARSSKSKSVGPVAPAASFPTPASTTASPFDSPSITVAKGHSHRRSPNPARNRRALLAAGVAAIAVAGLGAWQFGPFRDSTKPDAALPKPSTTPVAAAPAPPRPPKILFFVPQGFAAGDFHKVRDALLAAGAEVQIAACGNCKPSDFRFQPGFPSPEVVPDYLLQSEMPRIADFDALYLPGGQVINYKQPGPVRDRIANLVQEFALAGKPVAALGTGQGFFAMFGTLRGRSGSPNYEIAKVFSDYIEKPRKTPVTVDGPFITAVDDSATDEFTRTLLAEIRTRQAKSQKSP
jgi:serine/threonine protein kinase/putative intracellular protease/amidase